MEFAGNPAAFAEGLALARRGGSYLLVGQLGTGEISIRPSTFVHKNLRVLGSLAGGARDYWSAMEFIRHHGRQLPSDRLISNRYPLDRVNDVLEAMKTQNEVKPVVIFREARLTMSLCAMLRGLSASTRISQNSPAGRRL